VKKKNEQKPFAFAMTKTRTEEEREHGKYRQFARLDSDTRLLEQKYNATIVDSKEWTDDSGTYNSADLVFSNPTQNKRVYYR
jgi:hypothetical protein